MSCFAAAHSGRINLSDAHLQYWCLRRLIVPKAPFSAKKAKKSKHSRETRSDSDIMIMKRSADPLRYYRNYYEPGKNPRFFRKHQEVFASQRVGQFSGYCHSLRRVSGEEASALRFSQGWRCRCR